MRRSPHGRSGSAGWITPTATRPRRWSCCAAMADDNQLAADDGNQLATGIAGFESGGRAGAQNPYFPVARGGPLGPHQFIASTWQQFAQANPQLFAGMTPDQVLAARA